MGSIKSETFQEFYQAMGIVKYPFREKTAEKENSEKLFIKPLNYSLLEDMYANGETIIINGNRGTGKTMLLKDLRLKDKSDKIGVFLSKYEGISCEENLNDFYSLILKNIVPQLLSVLILDRKNLKKLSQDNKMLLSLLIYKYGDTLSNSQLMDKLGDVQLTPFKKLCNKVSYPVTAVLNYLSTGITNFGNELLTKHFGPYLPDVDSSTFKNIFPEIKFEIENEFKTVEISYDLLSKSLKLTKEVIGKSVIVYMDRLDEDLRLENDADLISKFIKQILCDSNLLLNSDIQLLISVWKIPFDMLTAVFRRSKHNVYDITWSKEQLEKVLNHRLEVYSNLQVKDYHTLFDSSISQANLDKIFELSNSNPRDLWTIFDRIFIKQHEEDSSNKLITLNAFDKSLRDFISKFEYYEYYPKKKMAQRNTNDIYSYIQHLLKLKDNREFTYAELRDAANTGGSTSNYITGMMNIGLVTKTDKKREGGAVIYLINDPKIIYAIEHEIDIIHNSKVS